jgi:predicted molibdopterin-dependent oxidoreductase YjgC
LPTAVNAELAEKMGAFEGKIDTLRNADVVLTIGANLAATHQVVGFMVKRALPKGVRMIVVDPGENELDELADLSLKNKAGSDLALLKGLQAVCIKENLTNIKVAVLDPDAVLAEAVKVTGLEVGVIENAARMLAGAISPVIVYGKGITAQGSQETLEALITLAKLVGAVDKERAGLFSLKGEANSLAAAQLCLDQPFKLNGHKAVFVALGDDYPSKRLVGRMEKAPYLVVQASYASALTEKADVVLPATIWAEQEGHYLNLDGRLQKATKTLAAPAGVREPAEVLTEIATRVNLAVHTDWQAALHARTAMVALGKN